MPLGSIHIPPWACDLLGGAHIERGTMRLPVVPDGASFDLINRIARAMGARWEREQKLFVFPKGTDVEKIVRHALHGASVGPPPPPGNPPDRFPTPSELAGRMIEHASVHYYDDAGEVIRLKRMGVSLLDVCAGAGHISGVALAHGFDVFAVEQDDNCVDYLSERLPGIKQLWHMDPKQWLVDMKPYLQDNYEDGELLPKLQFEAIVSHASPHDMLDIGLTHALWPFLRPGGRLVTVVSSASWYNDHIRAKNFQSWCDHIGADVLGLSDVFEADYGALNDSFLFVGIKPAEKV